MENLTGTENAVDFNQNLSGSVQEYKQVVKVNSVTVNFDHYQNGELMQGNVSTVLKITPELLAAMKLESAGLVLEGYDVTLE